ncbi:phosphate signaling complex protein PhoU [candidate division KSB1 bacterium]|nr:phosphate signaling complex protein PhoU [candidate division KSB1 bacterium]
MQANFEKELEKLKRIINQMADLVDIQVEYAIKALIESDIALCKVVKGRDKEIDAYDNLVQAQCESLFALFQPVAIDLRYIMAAMMVNNQLERCGDIAVNIVQRVKRTIDYKNLIEESKILEMAEGSRKMAMDAIEAFLNSDVDLAKKVIFADDAVDEYNKQIFKYLIAKMQETPEYIEPGAHLIVLSRHLERLADHATNIAEDVMFLVEATIVSHNKSKLEQE